MTTKRHLTIFNTLRLLLENEEILCVFVTSRHSYPHFYGEFPVRTIFTAYALQMNPCRPTKCVDCTNFPNASKTSSSKKSGHEKKILFLFAVVIACNKICICIYTAGNNLFSNTLFLVTIIGIFPFRILSSMELPFIV